MSQKRGNEDLTPPISDAAKRYLFNPTTLITKNKFYIPDNIIKEINQDEAKNNNNDTPKQQNQTTTSDMDIDQNKQPDNPKPKIPPIYLHEAGNYNEVLNDIKALTINEFTTVTKGKFLRINATSIEDYRNLTKFYNQSKVKYHTFKNPEENNLSVMIRNIPISLTEDEIKAELLNKKFPILKITRLYNKQRLPIPICAAELQKTANANEIFKLEKLNYCIVTVEPRRTSKDIAQCKRCQRFGHTKNYCQLEPRCVKCTGAHWYTECPKTPEQAVQCCNCQEKHPANWRGCSHYIKISRSQSQQPRSSTNNRSLHQNQSFSTNRTYTETLKANQAETTNTDGETADIIQTLIKQIINLIIPHIKPLLLNLLPSLLQNGI